MDIFGKYKCATSNIMGNRGCATRFNLMPHKTMFSRLGGIFATLPLAMSLVLFTTGALAGNKERKMLGSEVGIPLIGQTNSQALVELAKLRKAAAATGSIRVIVGLRTAFAPEPLLSSPDAEQQRRDIARARNAVLAQIPSLKAREGAVRQFETIPFMALTVTATELELLAQSPDVTSIHEDALGEPTLGGQRP